MSARALVVVGSVVLSCAVGVLGACGGEEEQSGSAGQPEAAAPVIAGMYEMQGTTTEKKSGATRMISGMVIIAQEGGTYTATFDLNTSFPTPDGKTEADVIGKGTGHIRGKELDGKAETQLVLAGVPGVDTQFAFVPRLVSKRLVSTMTGRLRDDGTLVVETENEGIEGEQYAATRTVLTGRRVPPSQAPGS